MATRHSIIHTSIVVVAELIIVGVISVVALEIAEHNKYTVVSQSSFGHSTNCRVDG